VIIGVVKSSLQTWHWSADSSVDKDDRGVPIQSVGSGTSPFEGIFVEGGEARALVETIYETILSSRMSVKSPASTSGMDFNFQHY
jgi:hypothetical protein